jgi:2-dehydropantoate 2-reductase
MTRVAVIGCGAMGSLFCAHLARLADVEVWGYDVRADHVAAMTAGGIRVTGAASFTAHPNASTDPHRIPPCDYGIVAVKSTATATAIEAAAHLFADDAAVCSIQNGLGNEELIAQHVPHVIRGCTLPAGRLLGPGMVHYDFAGDTSIGPFEPAPAPFERIETLAGLLTTAGLPTAALPDARPAQWTKTIFNAATNAVGALTGLPHGDVVLGPDTGPLVRDLVTEGLQVAAACGITLDADPLELLERSARAAPAHRSSMLQDIEAGRPTEVDVINGALVLHGHQAGLDTPRHRALWLLVKARELAQAPTEPAVAVPGGVT